MNLRLTSSALALAAMTAPAFADVTSEQVWQSWIDYYQSVGYQVTEGARDKAGDTLTVSGVVINGGVPDSKIQIDIPQVTLRETGDGKVTTVFADHMNGEASFVDPDGEASSVPFTVDQPGNAITTSGAAQDMTHVFNYPQMDVTLIAMKTAEGEAPLPVKVGVTDLASTIHIVAGAQSKYDYTMEVGKITFTGDVDTKDSGNLKFDGSMNDIAMSGDMNMPGDGVNIEEDVNAALKAGLAMNGVMKAGDMATTFAFAGTDEDGQPTEGNGKYDGKGFEMSFAMSQSGLNYQGGSDAANFEMTSISMPFPITYAIESGSFDMQMPVMQSDEAQPFKLAYSLTGLTLGDAIWNLFDAQGQLPRDPASLDLDVTGTAKITKDLFDPANLAPAPADDTDEATADGMDPDAPADDAEAMAEMDDADDAASSFEPVEVTINQFALAMLGAKVNAQGTLRAPESGDMTAPTGEIHATYEGVNGLIDKLGKMGLIPEDQMMGVRMMLAMFAKPAAGGADTLTTDLEFKEGGSIFANGQQIR